MAQSITEVILGTGNLFVASETDLNGSRTATFPTNPATHLVHLIGITLVIQKVVFP